ncbi:hypothetical protein F0562_014269 [Nyssa sinensis]|uniref:Uncharacterized protein n=1 Tax=Nyssa sinensis TaxID=561372 RepID=A0A5J4ZSC7_9ASTE|nr:hypothetical protein F0562_014269 [Nyssa sinensis]
MTLFTRPYAYSKLETEDPEETRHLRAQFLIYKVLEQADSRRRQSCLRVRICKLKIKIGKRLKKLRRTMLSTMSAAKVRIYKQAISQLKTLKRLLLGGEAMTIEDCPLSIHEEFGDILSHPPSSSSVPFTFLGFSSLSGQVLELWSLLSCGNWYFQIIGADQCANGSFIGILVVNLASNFVQGGIDVLLNDESKRETPAVVSFGEKQRFLGSAGAASATMHPKSTISQVKRLIGRKFKEPDVQDDLRLCDWDPIILHGFAKTLTSPMRGPTYVMFIDIGQCDTQVAVASFEPGHMKILSHALTANLGGRDFDEALADCGLTVEKNILLRLVGSGSRLPAITRILTTLFRREPQPDIKLRVSVWLVAVLFNGDA